MSAQIPSNRISFNTYLNFESSILPPKSCIENVKILKECESDFLKKIDLGDYGPNSTLLFYNFDNEKEVGLGNEKKAVFTFINLLGTQEIDVAEIEQKISELEKKLSEGTLKFAVGNKEEGAKNYTLRPAPGDEAQFDIKTLEVHDINEKGEVVVTAIARNDFVIVELTEEQYARIHTAAMSAFANLANTYQSHEERADAGDNSLLGKDIKVLKDQSPLVSTDKFPALEKSDKEKKRKAEISENERVHENEWLDKEKIKQKDEKAEQSSVDILNNQVRKWEIKKSNQKFRGG